MVSGSAAEASGSDTRAPEQTLTHPHALILSPPPSEPSPSAVMSGSAAEANALAEELLRELELSQKQELNETNMLMW